MDRPLSMSLPTKHLPSDVRWPGALLLCVTVLSGASVVASFFATRPMIAVDAAFYQHVGWYVLQGATPYVDVWDINPPLTFAVTAALALLAGGDVLVLHAMSAALTVAVVVASVLLVGSLAYTVTEDDAAALAAGLAMLVVPELYGLPPYGIRSQYFSLLFCVLSMVLVLRGRPLAAGASVAVGAGFWQAGAGFAPLVVGVAAQRDGWSGAFSTIVGGGIVAALVALPFVAAGALVPMVVQTVVAPLYGHAPFTLIGRTYAIALVLGYGVVVLPVALYGWIRVFRDRRELWWIPAGGLVFGLQILLVNMNGSLDALHWLVFVALGVAVGIDAVGSRTTRFLDSDVSRRQWAIVAAVGLVVLAVLAGPVWHLAPAAPGKPALEERHDRAQPDPTPPISAEAASVPDMRTIYWQKIEPETCHYRLSRTELRWIAGTEARLGEEKCGQWLP